MNILNVCIDAVKTVGTELILIGIRPYYKYEDGKKVDKIEGYRYEIVLCQRKYERLFVKIAGDQRIPFNEEFCNHVKLGDSEWSKRLHGVLK